MLGRNRAVRAHRGQTPKPFGGGLVEGKQSLDLAGIEIYDVMDQTATVKLSAHWGVDYMHLAKIDGKWMIKNVLWQSYPPEKQ